MTQPIITRRHDALVAPAPDVERIREAYYDRTLQLAAGQIAPTLNVQDVSVVLELAQERLDSLYLAPNDQPDARALERVREAASAAWLAK